MGASSQISKEGQESPTMNDRSESLLGSSGRVIWEAMSEAEGAEEIQGSWQCQEYKKSAEEPAGSKQSQPKTGLQGETT